MTEKQIKRLEELERTAMDAYLDNTNFTVAEWLDDKDQKEYCELYNLQFTEKNCVCGCHKEWQ